MLAAILTLFVILFLWYLLSQPARDLKMSRPGMDNRPAITADHDRVLIGEFFKVFDESDQSDSGSWPRFRGSAFDNIAKGTTPVSEQWPESGPPVMWTLDLGEGHAGAAVHKGKVYLLDYDEQGKADALRVFSFETGVELWRRWYKVHIKRNHGISRSIPTVTDKAIVTVGPRCHVMAVDTETGDLRWSMDLVKDFGAELPQWYTAQCPLIDGSTAVIAIGGDRLMVGVDLTTGDIVWETPNPDRWKMSHSSIFPTRLHGKKTYVYLAIGGIVGISSEGDDRGEILWKTSDWNPTVIAPSPLFPGNNEIIAMAGYGAGGARFKIEKSKTGFKAVLIEKYRPKEGLSSEHQTPILTGDHVWTIEPKDAGALRNQLVCYHVSDLKKPVWASGKENRYGLGPYLLVEDKMFLMNDDSELFLYKIIDHKSALLLDQHKVFKEGTDAWGPMVYIDGYLLLRDSRRLAKLYVGERSI